MDSEGLHQAGIILRFRYNAGSQKEGGVVAGTALRLTPGAETTGETTTVNDGSASMTDIEL